MWAGSEIMLPQGPNLFPLKVGLRWVFVNILKWVQKVGLGVQKWVKM